MSRWANLTETYLKMLAYIIRAVRWFYLIQSHKLPLKLVTVLLKNVEKLLTGYFRDALYMGHLCDSCEMMRGATFISPWVKEDFLYTCVSASLQQRAPLLDLCVCVGLSHFVCTGCIIGRSRPDSARGVHRAVTRRDREESRVAVRRPF